MTLIDVELECDDEREEASEADCEDDTGTGTWLFFSWWDGAVVNSGEESSFTEDHVAATKKSVHF